MFNSVQWEADLKGMKDEIEASPDKGWIGTVNLRYGFFMLDQVKRQVEVIQRGEHARDWTKQARDLYADETIKACSIMHAASALIRGAVITPDPLTCEAMMRLHARATTPQAA
jgi:hypothetical protein